MCETAASPPQKKTQKTLQTRTQECSVLLLITLSVTLAVTLFGGCQLRSLLLRNRRTGRLLEIKRTFHLASSHRGTHLAECVSLFHRCIATKWTSGWREDLVKPKLVCTLGTGRKRFSHFPPDRDSRTHSSVMFLEKCVPLPKLCC